MRSIDDSSIPNGGRYQNPNDLHDDYGLSDFHRAHVFSASWVWDLPRWDAAGVIGKQVIGGWQFSGLVRKVIVTSAKKDVPMHARKRNRKSRD